MKFGIYVSFDDHFQYFGTWGEPGVMYILDRVRAAKFDHVYWRMGSGQTMYPSLVATPLYKYKKDNIMDQASDEAMVYASGTGHRFYNRVRHTSFNAPRTAIDFGREIGLKVFTWSEIDAEAHGWGNESDFYDQHPELRSPNRWGKPVLGRVSWGRKEALEYRTAIMREHFAYGFDRVYLDFYKGGDHRIALCDESGVRADMYDDVVVTAFREKTGKDAFKCPNDDPEWVQFRADYITCWLRGIRDLQKLIAPGAELNAFVTPAGTPLWCEDWEFHPALGNMGAEGKKMALFRDPLSGNYEDIAAWTKEGLVDRLQYCLNPPCIDNVQMPDRKTLALKMDQLRRIMTRPVPVSVKLYGYDWNEVDAIEATALALHEEGVEEMVICESCPLERMPGMWGRYRNAFDRVRDKLGTE